MIDQTASVCPRCNRSQEPPANPDSLLDAGDEPAAKNGGGDVLYKDLWARSPVRHDVDIIVPTLGGSALSPTAAQPVESKPATVAAVPAVVAPVAVAPVAVAPVSEPAVTEPAPAPVSVPTPTIDMGWKSPPDAPDPAGPGSPAASGESQGAWRVNDLAAAFVAEETSVDLTPVGYGAHMAGGGGGFRGHGGGGGGGGGGGDYPLGPYRGGRTPDVPAILINDLPPFYPRRRGMGRPIVTLMFVAVLGVGVWLCIDDVARRRALDWCEDAYHALRRTGGEKTVASQRATPLSGVTAPDSRSTTPNGKPRRAKPTSSTSPSQPDNSLLPPPPPGVDLSPSPDTLSTQDVTAPPPTTTSPAPTTAPLAGAVTAHAGPTEFPFIAPDGAPEAAVPAATPASPASAPAVPDLQVLTQKARTLYNQALAAQGDRNYREAVRLYEQVKSTFPREVWPTDLEVKLRLARGQVK